MLSPLFESYGITKEQQKSICVCDTAQEFRVVHYVFKEVLQETSFSTGIGKMPNIFFFNSTVSLLDGYVLYDRYNGLAQPDPYIDDLLEADRIVFFFYLPEASRRCLTSVQDEMVIYRPDGKVVFGTDAIWDMLNLPVRLSTSWLPIDFKTRCPYPFDTIHPDSIIVSNKKGLTGNNSLYHKSFYYPFVSNSALHTTIAPYSISLNIPVRAGEQLGDNTMCYSFLSRPTWPDRLGDPASYNFPKIVPALYVPFEKGPILVDPLEPGITLEASYYYPAEGGGRISTSRSTNMTHFYRLPAWATEHNVGAKNFYCTVESLHSTVVITREMVIVPLDNSDVTIDFIGGLDYYRLVIPLKRHYATNGVILGHPEATDTPYENIQ